MPPSTDDQIGLAILNPPALGEEFPDAWMRIVTGDRLLASLRDAIHCNTVDTARRLLAKWRFVLAKRPGDARIVDVLLTCVDIVTGHGDYERLVALAARPVQTGSQNRRDWPSPHASEEEVFGWLRATEWERPFSAGWLMDVLQYLKPSSRAQEDAKRGRAVAEQNATLALLVRVGRDGIARGVVARLLVKAVAAGTGAVYPDPLQHAFLAQDTEFASAIAAAIACVKNHGLWPNDDYDFRWTLTRDDEGDVIDVSGPSAGLAFGLCLAQLLSSLHRSSAIDAPGGRRLRGLDISRLDIRGVAATAILADDGRIFPVGYGIEKVVSAGKDARLPKSHTAIVASDQALDLSSRMARDRCTGTWLDRAGNFVVEHAATFIEALEKIKAERWRRIDPQPLSAAGPRVNVRLHHVAWPMVAVTVAMSVGAGLTIWRGHRRADMVASSITAVDGPAATSPIAEAPILEPPPHATPERTTVAAVRVVPATVFTQPVEALSDADRSPQLASVEGGDSGNATSAPLPADPSSTRPAGLGPATDTPPVAKTPLRQQLDELRIRQHVVDATLTGLQRRLDHRDLTLRPDMTGQQARAARSLDHAATEIARPDMDDEVVRTELLAASDALATLELFLNINSRRNP